MLSKKAWKLFGEGSCFLCGKSLVAYIQETGKRFDMFCRTGNPFLMESWNWKTVCTTCLPDIEEIENQTMD